jgi:small subunit ribosomal protein S18
MGARSNRTLKQKPKVSSALNKKFKKKPCSFCRDKVTYIDYKDVATLRKYISDRGKIRARRVTGACTQHQRQIADAVKNSREVALLPYTSTAR